MILLKKAIKKSMEKKGGKEAKFANTMRIIKPICSSPKRPRRLAFKIGPSRLSTMSNSQDLLITQPGKSPIVVDLEEKKKSLVSKKRPRPSAIKLNGPSYPMSSNISKKQSAKVELTSERKKRAKFSQQAPKENVATPNLQMNRATPRATTNVTFFISLLPIYSNMHTRNTTLPPTPQTKETSGCTPFRNTSNDKILLKVIKKSTEKKGGKEAVVNSIKLKPTSRTKIRYTSHKMILLKKAIKKSMEKKGGKEADFSKTMRIIKPKRSSPKRPRRLTFKIRPSRLSTMSNSQDLPITQTGIGPIVVDFEENKESLVSKKRTRSSAIKLNGPSYPMTTNISKKQSPEVALTSDRKKMLKSSQESQKEKVVTLNPLTTRATRSSTINDYVFLYLVR